MKTSVFDMVRQVLADSREKVASAAAPAPMPASIAKTASAAQPDATLKVKTDLGEFSYTDLDKLASACDFLAGNLHRVVDQRTPAEKLAEYAEIHDALLKEAVDGPDSQTTQANPDSQPPVSPPTGPGVGPGGPDSAMQVTETNTPGTSLDAGQSGEATPANKVPTVVPPNESAYSTDAGNALETNKGMMMPPQPEDVLKQAAQMLKQAFFTEAAIGALNAPEGANKWHGAARGLGGGLVGGLAGGAGGAGLGAGVGALASLASRGRIPLSTGAGRGALVGYVPGALAGDIYGAYRGGKGTPVSKSKKEEAAQQEKTSAIAGSIRNVAQSLRGTTAASRRAAAVKARATPQLSQAARGATPKMNLSQAFAPIKAAALLEKAAEQGMSVPHTLQVLRTTADPEVYAAAVDAVKQAEDALFPAQISAGTEPVLQSAAGAPSCQSQGTEAGEGTPRETAPNTGEGSGRQFLSDNDAARNMTKGQAKSQNKGPLAELLTEPALSAAHDTVLQQSLDNTSSAGVKISAARELIRRHMAASPSNALKVANLVKKAMGEEGIEDTPEAAPVPPGDEGGEDLPMEPPSDAAMEAASAGVTPEELEAAQMLLASAGEEEEPAEAPPAGEGDMSLESQFGMGPSATPTPGPMM